MIWVNIPYVFKKCSKCGEWLVACKVNFYKSKGKKFGLESKCKKCRAEQHKQYYKNNKDKITEQKKQYYEDNKNKIVERCKQYRENNKDKIAERGKQYYKNNKDKIIEKHKQYYKGNRDKKLEQRKQYYKENIDKILKYHKQYYEENRDKKLEQYKQYRKENKDKIAEYKKQYYESPQGQILRFNENCRRRIKEQNQGNGITSEQWLECMTFFDWRCAYSGQALSKDTRSLDHIKPLNQGGKHEIWNVVPMDRGLNSSKNDKDLLEWYKSQDFFSEERLQKIYDWQEYAFNKWHNKEDII